VAKLPRQDDTAASLASVPILFTLVVVVVPVGDPPVDLGELGPFEIAIVTMTPRMMTTASVDTIPTPSSELKRREARIVRARLWFVSRMSLPA
jgi:hypothetical protein